MEPLDKTTFTAHIPVLFNEVIAGLKPESGRIFLDGTMGGGGHTIALAERVAPNGLVISIDRDAKALDRVEMRLKDFAPLPVRLAQANYSDFPDVLEMLAVPQLDGALLDLGLSSDQLADPNRGFSFDSPGEFDLRFDITEGVPAYELLNRWSEEKIANTIFQWGEERFSRRIARAIVEQRTVKPIHLAAEVAEICRRAIPHHPGKSRIDPATRTFQAMRIAVNEELQSLDDFLTKIGDFIRPGSRVAIISFHSLEDRIVKNRFRDSDQWTVITKKPIEASSEEMAQNPRSRSARLRIAEKK